MNAMIPDNIPPSFAQCLIDLHAEKGVHWLATLPERIEVYAGRWAIQVAAPFPNLSYNYVAPAIRADGSEAVLKMGVPNAELRREIAALECYAGQGVVKLLEKDEEGGVFLIERIRPGMMLADIGDDDQATRIAANLMRRMWRPLPETHPFRDVAEWMKGLGRLRTMFAGETGPFPEHLVSQAEALFDDLLASSAEPVLLHGDLHHYNILSAQGNNWLALDPKGMVGEPAYEVGALLHNPFELLSDWPDMPRILERRVAILAEVLEMDRRRIASHGMAQAVLSGWWSYEDHGSGWQPVMRCAEAMATLL